MNNRRLTKSSNNVVISGVLGGIAEYIGIDPTVLRLIYAICTPISGMALVPVYFVLMFIMPSGRGNGRSSRREGRRYYDNNRGYGGNPYSRNTNNSHSRKEAEKVDDNDDWSDF